MTPQPARPTALQVNPAGIPQALKARPQWVAWDFALVQSRWTKRPVNAHTGTLASTTDPATWTTFAAALAYADKQQLPGIGYVFSADDGLAGTDIDGCRGAVDGEITIYAATIADELNSYTEVTPSGTGLHIIVAASLPDGKGRKSVKHGIELYDRGRFFTMTGARLPEWPQEPQARQEAFDALYGHLFPLRPGQPADAAPTPPSAPVPDDADLLDRARNARNGATFDRLWRGDTSGNHDDDSSADLALCNLLAFWAGDDKARIDRLFRQSGLYRQKWERQDYRDATIGKALAGRTDYYDWATPRESRPGATFRLVGTRDEGRMGAADATDRPQLDAQDEDLPRITGLAWDALARANDPPRLFRFGGGPARLEVDELGRLGALPLTEDRLLREVAHAADWVKRRGKAGDLVPAFPPVRVVRTLLATPFAAQPLPLLRAITAAPTFAACGALLVTPGYHPDGRVYYAPDAELHIPPVADHPTAADVRAARALLLDDLLGDFPFTGDAERAHALGALLLPFVRDLIDGPTPLHLIEKPTAGTGATLLADMLLYPATGRPLTALTEGRDEDEWRKRLTALLRRSPIAVMIDNLNARLDATAVAAALTATEHEDRILGTSDTIRIPVRCVWLASGNNPALSNEMTRRTVRVRLDAHEEHPWLRQGFRIPQLRDWARDQRPHLIHAALTLGQAWLAAGKPHDPTGPRLGMYEHWSRVIGGILDVADVPGFLGNLAEHYDHADAEGADLHILIEAWWQEHRNLVVNAAELHSIVVHQGIPLDLGTGGEHGQRLRFGHLLMKLRDRRYRLEGGAVVVVTAAGKRRGRQQWTLAVDP